MSKEGKESKKNRWVISNVLYAFKCAWNCKKLFLVGMMLWAVATALVGYVWQFAVKYVIEAIEKGWDAKTVIYIVVAAGVIYAALYVVEVCSEQIQEYTGSYIVYHYRRKYNRKFMAMDFEKLENPEMLDEAEKAGKGCDFGGGILIGLCNTEYFLKDLVSAIIAAVVAATLNPWLLLVFTAIGLIKAVIQVRTKEVDKRECWDKMSPYYRKLRYLGQVQSDFSFAKDVRLFNMREFLKKKHIATNAAAHKLFLGHKNRWLKWNVKNLALSLLEMALQYGYLIYAFCFGDLTIAYFTLYITVMNTYTNSIRYLFDYYAELKNNSMQIDDYRNFVEEEELSLVKRSDLIPIPKSDKYVVEFKNVSFKYKGAKVYALKNVNLTLETGKSLAIVGLNGAGKTTLIKLLCRLYDVSEGEILLNGINILRFDRKEYYKLFSAVFQNVELFALSLGENVAMSERSKVDDKKSRKCASGRRA